MVKELGKGKVNQQVTVHLGIYCKQFNYNLKFTIMKQLVYLTFFILTANLGFSQDYNVEKIDWNSLQSYSASEIEFKSEEMSLKLLDCKYVEIKTESGITGLFTIGNGTIYVKTKNITDSIYGCLIRINPEELDSLIVIKNKRETNDKGFAAISKNTLNDSFGHCYQSNLDALIPAKGTYALNFFSSKYGEVLASYSGAETIIFNFTEKKFISKPPTEK